MKHERVPTNPSRRRAPAAQPFKSTAVAAVFAGYPAPIRRKLMTLRQLIFDTAATTDGVGEIEEALKWGEPAYLTSKTKSGSTIRIGWKESSPTQYAMYFHCQTTLVEMFRALFPTALRYERNRSIVFNQNDRVPVDELSFCIAAALTYHRKQKDSGALRRSV